MQRLPQSVVLQRKVKRQARSLRPFPTAQERVVRGQWTRQNRNMLQHHSPLRHAAPDVQAEHQRKEKINFDKQ